MEYLFISERFVVKANPNIKNVLIQLQEEEKGQYVTEILLCYSIPVTITFLVSLGKIFFGRKESFRLKYFLMVDFLETRLISTLQNIFGRYHHLTLPYRVSVTTMANYICRP